MCKVLLLLLFAFCYLSCVLAGCPHADTTLKPWSVASSWPNGVVPTANSNVVIPSNTRIVLDVSPPQLKSITVDGGFFAWGDYNNLEIVTEAFMVRNHGQIWIGSEDCLFTKKATITLTGTPTSGSYGMFGNKVLGAGANGTLELHGASYTTPWTRLSSTFAPPSYKNNALQRGMNVAVFNQNSGALIAFNRYDTHLNESHSEALATFISSQPNGVVIAVVAADEAKSKLTINAINAIRSIGSWLITQIGYRSGFVSIGVKGAANGTAVEELKTETQRPTRVITRSFSSFIINGQSTNPYGGFIELVPGGNPTINVADNVSWQVGQQIVIASTDQDYTHAEQNEILQVINSKQIKLKNPLKYIHWGQIENGVDERAEVGLLTRSITVRGRMINSTDTYGGQTRFLVNFTNVHIENVEFYQMGQDGVLGAYPVHFHMAHDVDAIGKYARPPYVRGCGIWKTFNRCVTVHGTRGVTVAKNVAYDHMGHCYFLEDGSEERNTFDGNLGISTKYGNTLLSDYNPARCTGALAGVCKGPATFWITNPNNVLINNVAAGSVAFGIWYVFPTRPMGFSTAFYPNLAIPFVPLGRFKNNYMHTARIGLMVDDGIITAPGPTFQGINGARYRPHQLPNIQSPRVVANFDDATIHHCTERGAWLRGGDLRMNRAKVADNLISVTLASEGAMPNDPGSSQEIYNSIFVGITNNNYTQLIRSRVRGFEVYDGPVRAINCSFFNFPNTGTNSSAIAAKANNVWQIATTNEVSGSVFNNVHLKVFYQTPLFDGDRNNVFLDTDGAVAGRAKHSVVTNLPVHTTKRCVILPQSQAATCPDKYGMLFISNRNVTGTNFAGVSARLMLIRDEKPTSPMNLTGTNGTPATQFQPLVVLNKSYTLHFAHPSPPTIRVQLTNFDKNDNMRLGVCYPKNSVFNVVFRRGNIVTPLTKVTSLAAVDSNTNATTSYFWDNNTGLIFVKLIAQNNRNGLEYCGSTGCESVEITATGPGIGRDSGYCANAYPTYTRIES